ncbi:hypothetical protein M514_06387, partial [Trichuris suis]
MKRWEREALRSQRQYSTLCSCPVCGDTLVLLVHRRNQYHPFGVNHAKGGGSIEVTVEIREQTIITVPSRDFQLAVVNDDGVCRFPCWARKTELRQASRDLNSFKFNSPLRNYAVMEVLKTYHHHHRYALLSLGRFSREMTKTSFSSPCGRPVSPALASSRCYGHFLE